VEAEQPIPPKARLFGHVAEETLLSYGVPAGRLQDVRQADEYTLRQSTGYLPNEAAEALLELVTGGRPSAAQPAAEVANPFEHPDAQRRFRVMTNVEELARVLDYPWERWTSYLHPAQRQWVEGNFNGPTRVSGAAGTGKTIVALHRAVFLARANLDVRVLLTTFSDALLASRLQELLALARTTGKLLRTFIWGSFVTAKPFPRDLDVFMLMQRGFDHEFLFLPLTQRDVFTYERAVVTQFEFCRA
jgi:hypothetical protein